MALITAVGSRSGYQVYSSDLELVRLLGELAQGADRATGPFGLVGLQSRFSGALPTIIERARALGLAGPATLLGGLRDMRFSDEWRAALSLTHGTVGEAARGMLAGLAAGEDVEAADEAARLLAPHTFPDERSVALLRRQLGPGADRMAIRRLLVAAAETMARGGVPPTSFLTAEEAAGIEREIGEFFSPHKFDVKVPTTIGWEPAEGQPGVGYGQPLVLAKDGSTVVPVWISAGAYEQEQLYLGAARHFVFPQSEISSEFAGPGALLALAAERGKGPVVFFRAVQRGTVLTGLRGTRGAQLAHRRGVGPALLAAIFDGIPPDTAAESPRTDLSRALWALLKRPQIEPVIGQAGLDFFLHDFVSWSIRQRLEYARRLHGAA